MRRARGRVLVVAAAVLVTGVLATSCSSSGDGSTASTTASTVPVVHFEFSGNAATIDGEPLAASVIADAIQVFEDAPAAMQQAFQTTELYQAGTTEPSPLIVADLLSTEIAVRLIEKELSTRGLTPSQSARALAVTQVRGYFGDALDARTDYRDQLIERYAGYVTLDEALNGPGPDEAALRAEYDKDSTAYDEACARHILVDTEQKAKDLAAQIAAGADFAALAKSSSTDTGSGAVGGDLGCQARGVYVAEFEDAVWNGPVDVVQGPIKTQFGYHLLQVTKRGARTFEAARADVAQALAPQPFAALQGWLAARWLMAKITVDARFGTWDGTTGQVTPVGFAPSGLELQQVTTTSR